jgi:Arabinose-binding domain of AraC transcription regulator, N-term
MLLRRAGLSERDFDSRQPPVAAAAQFKFFEFAAEAMDDGAFGLHLAKNTNPREAGLLFYVMSAANDVGEALALFARYSRIVNEALRVKLVPAPQGIVVKTGFVGLSRFSAKQATEFGVALTIRALREITGRNVHPTQVSFIHGRNSNLRSFERFFRCPVEFAASSDQFALAHDTLALPHMTEDRYLLETLQPVCDHAAEKRSTMAGTLRASVENEVQKLLPHGKARKQHVAKTLGLSEANARAQAARGGHDLRGGRGSVAPKPRARIPEGAGRVAFTNGVAARLRGRVLSIMLSGDGQADRLLMFEMPDGCLLQSEDRRTTTRSSVRPAGGFSSAPPSMPTSSNSVVCSRFNGALRPSPHVQPPFMRNGSCFANGDWGLKPEGENE